MTLMFATLTGLLLGVALGRTRLSLVLAAFAWYVFLALQTAYLARPGATGFGGKNGHDALQGAVYWLAQPAILALTIGLLLIGGRVRDRFTRAFARRTRTTLPAPNPTIQ